MDSIKSQIAPAAACILHASFLSGNSDPVSHGRLSPPSPLRFVRWVFFPRRLESNFNSAYPPRYRLGALSRVVILFLFIDFLFTCILTTHDGTRTPRPTLPTHEVILAILAFEGNLSTIGATMRNLKEFDTHSWTEVTLLSFKFLFILQKVWDQMLSSCISFVIF